VAHRVCPPQRARARSGARLAGIPSGILMRYCGVRISPANDAGYASGGPPRPPPTWPAQLLAGTTGQPARAG
jgi:hypothetical protein